MRRGRPFGSTLGLTDLRRTVLRACMRQLKLREIATLLGHNGHGHVANTVHWLRAQGLLDDKRRLTVQGLRTLEVFHTFAGQEVARGKI